MKNTGIFSSSTLSIALASLACSAALAHETEPGDEDVKVLEIKEQPLETLPKKSESEPPRLTSKPSKPAPPTIDVTEDLPPPVIIETTPIPPPVSVKEDSNEEKKRKKRRNRWKRQDVILSDDGKTLHIVGSIMPGLVKEFKKKLKSNPDVTSVLLSSNGGSVIHGMALGNIVARRKLDTHVDFVCASACTLIFAQGVNRTAGPNGSLGFHRSYRFRPSYEIETEDGKPKHNAGNQAVEAFYADAGVSDVIIKRTLETPSRTMWFPPQALLTKEKLVNAITAGPQGKVVKGDWVALADVQKAIEGNPVWEEARRKRPEYYRGTLSSVWTRAIILDDVEEALQEGEQRLVQSLLSDALNLPDGALKDFAALQADIWKHAETMAASSDDEYDDSIEGGVAKDVATVEEAAEAAAEAAVEAAKEAVKDVDEKKDAKKDSIKTTDTEDKELELVPPPAPAIEVTDNGFEEEEELRSVHRKFLDERCSGRLSSRTYIRMPQSEEHKARWSKLISKVLSYPQLKRELTEDEKQDNEVALLGFYGLMLSRDDVKGTSIRYQMCRQSPEIFATLAEMPQKRRIQVLRALLDMDNTAGRYTYEF